MIPQFIFGGNTGVTAGELAKRRALAEAMLERSQASMPRNLGEGIGALGQALAGRMAFNRIAKQEREGQGRASSGMSQLMASLFPETAAPAEGPAAPAGGAPVAAPQGDTFANMQQAESGMDPEAVSPKGAIGLSQIMPSTARDPGYGLPNIFDVARKRGFEVDDTSDKMVEMLLREPDVNTDFGRAYFDKMKARNGGSDLLGAAAYNAGPGAVQKAGGVPNFPETQAYVKKLGLTGGGAPQQPAPQQMAQAQPAAGGQPQQAAPQDTLRGIATFMSSPDFGFLRPEQQQFVADAFKREMNRANPDPLAALDLEEKQLKVDAMRNPEPKTTDDIREYEYAKQQGFSGSFNDFKIAQKKASATSVNVNNGSEVGTIPQGFELITDSATGARSMRPIAGSQAAIDEMRLKEKGDASDLHQAEVGKDVVLVNIDKALKNVSGWSTGLPGQMTQGIGGSPALKLRALIDPIKANIGFDRLQQMRRESPTGGALGQVAVQELDMLQATLGSLDPNAGAEILSDNLKLIKTLYERALARNAMYGNGRQTGQQPAPGSGGGPQPGAIEDGFRFRGGNPADPNSWEPVQ